MEINTSEYINDIVRVLIILDTTSNYKSERLTENRIELYDFFLRFPKTMGVDEQENATAWSFDECYSFFHWQPDIVRYRQAINYSLAKGFATKTIVDNAVVYTVTDIGKTALAQIENSYKNNLVKSFSDLLPCLIKLSDKRIEEMIRVESKAYIKEAGVL